MRPVTALATAAVGGVVLVASWHAGERGAAVATPGVHVIASAPGEPGRGSATAKAPATTAGPPGPAPSGSAPRKSSSRPSAGSPRREVTGALVATQYGNVQVRIVLRGTRIEDVQPVHLTDSSGTSVQISAGAAPVLRSEALTAQSADIDLVSGATYTSEGYKQSLQAAIDAAHL